MASPLRPPPPPASSSSTSSSASSSPTATFNTPDSRSSAAGPSVSSGSASHATPLSGVRLGVPTTTTTTTTAAHRLDAPVHGESSRAGSHLSDDIEMEPIAPAGHRRRRSSLLSTSRRKASASSSSAQQQDEPKIVEEEEDGEDGGHSSWQEEDDDDISDEDLHDDEETGLTRKDKRRKQRKRQQNTTLDNRIVKEKITPEERKQADQNVLRKLVVNGSLILLWYLFSLCISLYNKWMFDKGKLNFPFPMFTTAVHMLVQFGLSCIVLYFVPSLRPKNGYISNRGQSRHEAEVDKPVMTKTFYLTRVGPCGAATGLDIGLGNTSLKFITLTFYTMCKSSSLAFVLIFAFLFRLEVPTWRLVAIIATMTAGVVMMVAGEVKFELGGFVLVISAAFFSGFRWGLTQILLLRNPATSNPFSSIFFLAPVMFVTLASIAIPVEGFSDLLVGLKTLSDEHGAFLTPVLILFPGTIAFLMTASEFALLQRTSIVTLSIAGIFKEVVTISTATLVFHDKLTPVNFGGLVVTMTAICAYNYIKITKMREEAQMDVHRGHLQADETGSSSPTSAGGSGSDAENDADAEDAGLLRKVSADEDCAFVTADGDIIPRPERSPVRESRMAD